MAARRGGGLVARDLERLPEILAPLEPGDPALAQGPGVSLLVDELPLASPAADVPADGGHDDVSEVVQLPELVAGSSQTSAKARMARATAASPRRTPGSTA